ncbi:MAG: antibiotic biosynthesis monooxygenase [Acidobacteriota bacterium]
MTAACIEIVTFRLRDETSIADFLRAASDLRVFLEAAPGFLRRRLSRADDGSWIDHVEWASRQAAEDAAVAIGRAPEAHAFIAAIDGASVILRHARLEVALG